MKLKCIFALVPLALALAVTGCEQNDSMYDETPGTAPGEAQTNQPPETPPAQP